MPSCAPVRPARSAARLARPGARLSGNYGMRVERAARDVLPGHPVARHIDDFLTDLANANKLRNMIRAYGGDLIAFAACHDGEAPGARRRRLCRVGAPLLAGRGQPRPALSLLDPAEPQDGPGGAPTTDRHRTAQSRHRPARQRCEPASTGE